MKEQNKNEANSEASEKETAAPDESNLEDLEGRGGERRKAEKEESSAALHRRRGFAGCGTLSYLRLYVFYKNSSASASKMRIYLD